MATSETGKDSESHNLSSLYHESKKPEFHGADKIVGPFTVSNTLSPLAPVDPVIFAPGLICKTPRMLVCTEPHLPTMFGQVPEKYVIFCIDTSGSMFHTLDVVKKHLIETLSALETCDSDKPMFNLIEFNSEVTQWADELVQCTPENVAAAKHWINSLKVKTGTNTQDALLTAFSDKACEAVYLVTDGLPDQYVDEVLDKVIESCGACRIHCIYIADETVHEAAVEFLEDLALETFGSFHIVTMTSHGCVERIAPIYRADHSHKNPLQTMRNMLESAHNTNSISTALHVDPGKDSGALTYIPSPLAFVGPVLYPKHPYYWSRFHTAKSWLTVQEKFGYNFSGLSPGAGSLLVGKKVLARRLQDGYFYRATVKGQNARENFLVAFSPVKNSPSQTEYEDVHVSDIVDYTESMRHNVILGDRVLAPWEADGGRFGPGIVAKGQKRQQTGYISFTVSFCNGYVGEVTPDVAFWIPLSLYERLVQK